jgi:hypothetical protein
MRTFASPTFVSSTSSRMEVAADTPMATEKQLRIQPYLCVSYDKEEDFYQPMRLLNAALIGPLLLVAATQVKSDLLKVVTGGSGLVLMFGSGIRYYEAYEEMTRYREAFAQKESR